MPPAPDRAEGEGPYARLILRGGILIDGTGSPAFGPVDIVIENNGTLAELQARVAEVVQELKTLAAERG